MAAIGHKVDLAQLALMVLHRLPKSYKGFVTMVTVDERSRPLTFDELAPLMHKEAQDRSDEKALAVKDKGGKGKPKNSQLGSSDADKSWKKTMKCWYCEVLGSHGEEVQKEEG